MEKKVTVIGGGTGTYVILSGLKKYPVNLAVVVSMFDSGGSTGRLRDQLGVLPPGDLRQCLVALSEAPILWRKLFLYRFEKGDLAGHNFGNIFLSALEKISKNYQAVVDTAGFILKTKGEVIPVTFQQAHLCVLYKNGKLVEGEGQIDKNFFEKSAIIKAYLKPEPKANPKAIRRILQSDFIIVGPGDLYTSIVPVLLVKEVKKALSQTKAKIIYILNLMTKRGQATDYKGSDYLKDMSFYLGRLPDVIIANNGKIPKQILAWYKKYKENQVVDDINDKNFSGQVYRADLVDKKKIEINEADFFVDPASRSILRHDSLKLAKILSKIIL